MMQFFNPTKNGWWRLVILLHVIALGLFFLLCFWQAGTLFWSNELTIYDIATNVAITATFLSASLYTSMVLVWLGGRLIGPWKTHSQFKRDVEIIEQRVQRRFK